MMPIPSIINEGDLIKTTQSLKNETAKISIEDNEHRCGCKIRSASCERLINRDHQKLQSSNALETVSDQVASITDAFRTKSVPKIKQSKENLSKNYESNFFNVDLKDTKEGILLRKTQVQTTDGKTYCNEYETDISKLNISGNVEKKSKTEVIDDSSRAVTNIKDPPASNVAIISNSSIILGIISNENETKHIPKTGIDNLKVSSTHFSPPEGHSRSVSITNVKVKPENQNAVINEDNITLDNQNVHKTHENDGNGQSNPPEKKKCDCSSFKSLSKTE